MALMPTFSANRTVRNKVVLITGAARGIGAGLAERLAADGAKVALVGIEADEQRKVADRIGPAAKSWEADVTDWEALEKAVAGVVDHFGGIDIVVANAGIATTGFVRSVDPVAFERVFEVDLLGVWRTFRVTLPHVIARKGYLLAISSFAAVVHAPGMANYASAKAGVEAFCNSLRAEVAHLGVKVGVAHPTWIKTDLVESADAHPVFGKLRSSVPGPLGKTYPLDVALDQLHDGIRRRARTIHIPRWVGAMKLIRAFLPPFVEAVSRLRVPRADKAALEDIARRGAREAAITGRSGRAATEIARE
ncbi:SDR family oxidoreductase [Saccharomonospora viridis]|jgi:NAD(P)-dependent dehydrogenase (short-subunit alcohol dehydrogenase family)|uniref:Short-chain alcohol dehydrogenase n=2 Tax=Saccharomonospora viridis TaxID=1852 RepID=C7MRI4_SACVD|nr:SDR family oxidoreductase [Saccharomonospora viridis]ACU98770.1 short-chain alcohol dehydrogenase [Saccharomonospora viridis DSM 43017]KHF44564.1 short-chain dehydrogenase [Saccharomonospora viridis]SFP25860.1 NADP-dependent 3-hydroxy acid dehydrogenase YdfG [Saccharomonospora viridis]